MKRGIFGCDLKHQVTVIGFTYCALSILGIVFGCLLLDHPERFADQSMRDEAAEELEGDRKVIIEDLEENDSIENLEYDTTFSNLFNQTKVNMSDIQESLLEYSEEDFDDLKNEETTKEEEMNMQDDDGEVEQLLEDIEPSPEMKHYKKLIHYIKNEGIEAIIGSFLKLFCSILLIRGARLGKPWFLVPWMVEECIEMIGGFIHFSIQAARNNEWSLGGLLLGILFYLLGGYFLYTVASFHQLLRRMNTNSSMIVASVSQGVTGGFQSGLNYQRLEEDCWQSRPNLASEFAAPGFVREKKVDTEEDADEHVLYVQ